MTVILTDPQERTRFLKFAVVGAIGAVIDFGVMDLLTTFGHMPLVPAGIISFTCAVVSNFIWNRFWTYPDSRSRPILNQLAMFFVVNVAGVGIRIPILHYGEPFLLGNLLSFHLTLPGSTEFWANNLTLAVAIGVVMLWNFFINRYWTYNDVGQA